MQPYQNYLNQQFNNPYYSTPNWSSQQFNQPQTQQQQFSANLLNGRTVTDFNTISASDVPMDGSVAVFIKNDLSEIQTRQWTPNGNIKSVSYVQTANVSPDEEKSKFESKIDLLFGDFDEIKERLVGIEKMLSPKRVKREVTADD